MIKIFEKFNEPEIHVGYWDNEQKKKWYEIWKLNGEFHRVDGPAEQGWYRTGEKEYESWYLNGESHREDGPAYQMWDKDGKKYYESWWLNNNSYKREYWVEDLKNIGSPHYEEQRMLYNMEKYNI